MAEAYDKGKAYELHVSKLVRRKADKGSMRNRGSHTGGTRRSDVFTNLPIHIEAKHHESVRIKEWMEQAEAAANAFQTAVVAFRIDDKDYACLNLNDLLDLFVQIADQTLEIQDLHAPIEHETIIKKNVQAVQTREEAEDAAKAISERKVASGAFKTCRAGHICDQYGYCMQKGCKYTRGYNAKRAAKKEGKK